MPAQYPGNSVTKAAKSDGTGGFVSDISGGQSGGTDALTYNAPSGVADGETITLSTDGSEGWNFGPAPTELATMGFGQGLLYTAALGNNFQDHVDPFSGATWDWEFADFSAGRSIIDNSGIRALKVANYAGGFVTFQTASLLPENEKVFVSSMSRAAATFANTPDAPIGISSISSSQITLSAPYNGVSAAVDDKPFVACADPTDESLGVFRFRATIPDGGTVLTIVGGDDPVAAGVQTSWVIGYQILSQWKGLRVSDTGGFGSTANSPGRNDFYTTPGNGIPLGWNPATGDWKYTSPALYDGPGDQLTQDWVRLDHMLELGNLSTANGKLTGNVLCGAEGSAVYGDDYVGDGLAVTMHTTTKRVGAFSWQDYTKGLVSPGVERTDFFVQVGSLARVELSNGATPATATEAYILPPVIAEWTSTSIKVLLWKSLFTGYTGKYLHFFDATGTFRKAVAI